MDFTVFLIYSHAKAPRKAKVKKLSLYLGVLAPWRETLSCHPVVNDAMNAGLHQFFTKID